MMALTPLRGDPAYVASQAAEMVTAADRMEQAASRLRALMNGAEYRSDAVDAVAVNAEALASVMTKASIRYRGTGEALKDYATVLDAAQQQADGAIGQQASTDVWSARSDVLHKEAQASVDFANPLTSEEERERGRVELAQARQHLAQQEAQSAVAAATYEDARADVERAAVIAMGRIKDSIEASGLNDSFWDDFEGFKDEYLVPILNAVVEVLTAVNKILGALSLVLAFIPGLQGLAAALKTLSFALTLVTFVATVMLTVLGERTVGELLTASLLMAAATVKLKGGPKTARQPGDDTLKGSAHNLFKSVKDGHPEWRKGGAKLYAFGEQQATDLAAHAVLPKDVADFVVNPRSASAHLAGDVVDAVLPSDAQPSTDKLATRDVNPVGNDFSSVNVDSIISSSFANQTAPHAPAFCSSGGGR